MVLQLLINGILLTVPPSGFKLNFLFGFTAGPENSVCPAGHYCPEGTGTPFPCPVGTYNEQLQAVSDADCLPCPAGKYCPNDSMDDVTMAQDCKEGYE